MSEGAPTGPDAASQAARLRWRESVGLVLVLAFAALQLTLFAVYDRRPANDHDVAFTSIAEDRIEQFADAPWPQRPGIVLDELLAPDSLHPRLAQASLVAFAGTFGWSRLTLRLSNLPWLLLLVGGTWALGRQVGGPRLALLAAFLSASTPVLVHMSRKWFIHFHGAALVPAAWALGLALLGGGRWWLWAGFGGLQAARALSHPIGLPDAALLHLIVGAYALRRGHLRGFLLATAVAALGAAPLVLGEGAGGHGEGTLGIGRYWEHAAGFFDPQVLKGWLDEYSRGRRLGFMLGTHLLQPPLIALLFVPGLLLLPFARMPGRLLGLTLLAHAPLIVLSTAHRAFPSDWIHVVPLAIVAALAGLSRLHAAVRWPGAALLVANGASIVGAPLALSFAGPPLPAELDWYRERPRLAAFLKSEHGWLYNTHHYLLRDESPGTRLGELLAADAIFRVTVRDAQVRWCVGRGDCPGDVATLGAPVEGLPGAFDAGPTRDAGVHVRYTESDGAQAMVLRLWCREDADEIGPGEGECWRSATGSAVVAAVAEMPELQGRPLLGVLRDPHEWLLRNHAPGSNPSPGYRHAAVVLGRRPSRVVAPEAAGEPSDPGGSPEDAPE
jgi:hypothetical protein